MKTHEELEVIALKIFLVMAATCLCIGCNPAVEKSKDKSLPLSVSNYEPPIYSIHTANHDGHMFVIWTGSQKGGMLHHPDCPCGKKLP